MEKIDIPFNNWSGARLMAGDKNSTWRSKSYGHKGDTFIYLNKRFELICEPFQIPMAVVIYYLYRLEGAKSPEELMSVLRSIKRSKELDLKELGWLHVFVEVMM